VLGIRNAPPVLAKRLVEQALVVEDRRDAWLRTGERVCAASPSSPGVYVLRDDHGRALYVGKSNNVRRRLRTHFAPRRWRAIKPEFARAADAAWQVVGSEVEALVLEALWIRQLAPVVNVQVGQPVLGTRAVPASLVRDTLLVLPSADESRVVLLAARASGPVTTWEVARDGVGLASAVTRARSFFRAAAVNDDADDDREDAALAPLVFSWLAGRGASATRLDPHDAGSAGELRRRIERLLDDAGLFTGRIVVVGSGVRSTSKRP
jgi:predicted GIY-YIG superfamily endonuclease